MPTIILAFAIFGAVLLFVAVLPRFELWAPRRYSDIVYIRLRRHGARIDVWQGKPVTLGQQAEFEWSEAERAAFDREGLPDDTKAAARRLRQRMRPLHRSFPFGPIVVLHAIDQAMHGLTLDDRRRLAELGEVMGGRVMVGDLPNAFPERAFQEIRDGAQVF